MRHAVPDLRFLLLAVCAALSMAPGASAQQPRQLGGEWSAPIAWPHVAVSMSNLPDGRVLTWASNERDAFPGNSPEFTYAATFDPATGQFLELNHPAHDMFCASIVMIEDGSVFVSGGRNMANSPWTSLFDYRTDSWIPIENMNRGRWYPTSVALPNGQVFIAVGQGGEQFPEVYTPGQGWQLLTGIDLTESMISYGNRDGTMMWPLLQLEPSGTIFHGGAVPIMNRIDPTGLGSIQSLGPHGASWFPDEGVSVLYDAGKMLVAGGSTSITNGTSSANAMVIDLVGPSPVVTPVPGMNAPRQFMNEILLPDGRVLVVGGNRNGAKFNDAEAVYEAEVWDPDTLTWTTWNAMSVPRTYHSTATLLTDGRVLSAGGGLSGGNPSVNHQDGEIFSPPYLFDPDGSPATRPEITAGPDVVRVGASFELDASPQVTRFTMVRMSGTTHTMNTDLRFLEIPHVVTSPGRFALTLESNPNVLMPGFWMVWALDAQGVPSVAKVVQVVTTGVPQIAPVADPSDRLGDEVRLQLEAADPDGNSVLFSATGLPPGLSLDPQSGLIEGVLTQTGIFDVAIAVDDGTETAILTLRWFVTSGRSEVGTVSVIQANANQWHRVDLQHVYSDPIVVMGPPSFGNGEPVTVRVREVSPTSFEFQLDEWDYQNGFHPEETTSYLVVEAGSYRTASGDALVAGKLTIGTGWATQVLDPALFSQTPIVLSQAASRDHAQAVTTRTRAVSTSSFQVRLQQEEAANGEVAGEELHWIALEPGAVAGEYAAELTPVEVEEFFRSYAFGQSFGAAPHLLGDLQTHEGGDPANLRHRNLGPSSFEVFLQEETSDDSETGHVQEAVGWLAIAPGVTELDLISTENQAPSVASPTAQRNVEGDAVALSLIATDDDGDPLTFSATGLPPGLGIDPGTGEIQGVVTTAGSYQVVVTATDPGGLSGMVTFAWQVDEPLVIQDLETPPRSSDEVVSYTVTTNLAGSFLTSWSFGDGSPDVGPLPSATIAHTFTGPGRFVVTVTVEDPVTGMVDVHQFVQVVHAPLAAARPTTSSSLVYDEIDDRLWVVNPDNDSVSVFDAGTGAKLAETAVGTSPRTLAIDERGDVWVASKRAATLSILDPSSFAVVATLPLAEGSAPHGLVFDPAGRNAFVSLEATGQVLRFDALTRAPTGSAQVGASVRGLAVSADGGTLYASRFISPPVPGEAGVSPAPGASDGGQVVPVDASTLAVLPPIVLRHSNAPISTTTGPGLPNYVGALAPSPDGQSGWVPSKQDNILGGSQRSGVALAHDSTVRAVTSLVDLGAGSENLSRRVDHDDASIASAALFGRWGAYLFVALEGNRRVAVLDPFGSQLGLFAVGRAPQGLAISPDGRTLYVHNFMDRTITVHGLDALIDFGLVSVPTLATWDTVAAEALAPNLLNGKRLFYDALDPRLALQSYMACASCHNDGDGDGRTWDFGQFGEGVRNTIALRGHGQGHGRLHWSANFDEVQDFEGQIRGFAGGTGLMSDADFFAGTRQDPLGDPKAGLSPDLDDLAAYVGSLVDPGSSPDRVAGALSPAGALGRQVFASAGCAGCHAGEPFTDSASGALHDVGTLGPASGPQTALDTPTLLGLWETAPYLHDGSAASLEDAIQAHAPVSDATDRANLVAYLRQIDWREGPPAGTVVAIPLASGDDDVEERASGGINRTSSDLELSEDGSLTQTVGLRFRAMPVPQGAVILSAALQFTTDEVSTGPVSLTVEAQAADDAAPFTTTRFDVSSRARTAASAIWSPADWSLVGEAGAAQRSPDLASLVAEVVGRPGWLAGNDLVLILTGSGRRTAESFNGSSGAAPVLEIEYTTGSSNGAPDLVSPGDQQGHVGDAALLALGATDPEDDPLDWAATGLPQGLALDAETGLISGVLAEAGSSTVEVSVSDGASVATVQFAWVVSEVGGSQIFERRVGTGADDAEERANGNVSLTSSDLELTTDGTSVQRVGIRFVGIGVPQGATIRNAWVQFQVDEVSIDPASLLIAAEAADDAAPFTTTPLSLTSRATTTAIAWSPAPWPSVGAAGGDQRTPDLAAVLQQVVDRPGWQAGQALAVLIDGVGRRTAEAWNGQATAAPLLHVEYTTDPDPPSVLDVSVASGDDDAEERSTGGISLGSSDLELTTDGSNVQTVGVRFASVAIPAGSTIERAYLQFTVDEVSSGPADLLIDAHAADDAAPIAAIRFDLSGRVRTANRVSWAPPDWGVVGASGVAQRTPDLSGIVQELVDRPGWSSGQAMTLLIEGTGRRTAESANGAAGSAPTLHVEYR